jgi:phage/plasmid-associated DNA primase
VAYLNIALAGLARLKANGWKFSYDKTVEDVEVMYKRNANPVYAFLIDECEPGGAPTTSRRTLLQCVQGFCASTRYPPIEQQEIQ